DHSKCPQLVQAGARLHMGQFSVTILAAAGSILSGNQHVWAVGDKFEAVLGVDGIILTFGEFDTAQAAHDAIPLFSVGAKVSEASVAWLPWKRTFDINRVKFGVHN
ncbi:hypothetical protein EGN72_07165, partial [Pseudorhodobacter sp. E13]|uniref:hypothetical protein n=1 Tax=Pseudorhodobacter sp. E13 TaxID=2487931 RepID=UPI000F949AE8